MREDKRDKQITAKQKKIIWASWKNGIGLPDEDLYSLILALTGKDRMSCLSEAEGDDVIWQIRQKAEGSVNGATAEQLHRIKVYAATWNWSVNGLRTFLSRVAKQPYLAKLTSNQARSVITAMERMNRKNIIKKRRASSESIY